VPFQASLQNQLLLEYRFLGRSEARFSDTSRIRIKTGFWNDGRESSSDYEIAMDGQGVEAPAIRLSIKVFDRPLAWPQTGSLHPYIDALRGDLRQSDFVRELIEEGLERREREEAQD